MKSMYSDQFLTTTRNIKAFLKRSGWILLVFALIGVGFGIYKASKEVQRYETTFVAQTQYSSAAVAVELLNSLNGKEGKLIQMEGIGSIDLEAKSQMTNLKNDSINVGGIEIQFRYSDSVDLQEVTQRLEEFVNADEVMFSGGDLTVSLNFPTPLSIAEGWFKNIVKNLLKFLMFGLAIAFIIDLRNALKNQTNQA